MIYSVQEQNPGSRRSYDGMLSRTQEKGMHMFDLHDQLLNISLPTIKPNEAAEDSDASISVKTLKVSLEIKTI